MSNLQQLILQKGLTRRRFIAAVAGGATLGTAAHYVLSPKAPTSAETFIAKVDSYASDLSAVMLGGLGQLGITPRELKGKRILLKPNLVETSRNASHINTHPLVIRGAIEAFLKLGALAVIVGEGPGHVSDTVMVLEETGLADVLYEDRIPFVDLNNDDLFMIPNATGLTGLNALTFPQTLKTVDWIVSLAKMKTHHWAGVTLSMKNLFGVMPGIAYGWPKNVFHMRGIQRSIIDINATLKPHFAIVDGVVGMEGDGPIMGTPKTAGVLVMGRNLAAVDATSARVMSIDPRKVDYLAAAERTTGPISDKKIQQRGETLQSVRTTFQLDPAIPAQAKLLA